MKTNDSSRFLRASLFSNAVFSAASGVCFIAASRPLASLTGLNLLTLAWIGVSLLVFAAGLAVNAKRPRVKKKEAWLAVILDLAWVAASVVVIAAGILTTTGNWAAAIIADVVLVFAVLQFLGLRKMEKHTTAECGIRGPTWD